MNAKKIKKDLSSSETPPKAQNISNEIQYFRLFDEYATKFKDFSRTVEDPINSIRALCIAINNAKPNFLLASNSVKERLLEVFEDIFTFLTESNEIESAIASPHSERIFSLLISYVDTQHSSESDEKLLKYLQPKMSSVLNWKLKAVDSTEIRSHQCLTTSISKKLENAISGDDQINLKGWKGFEESVNEFEEKIKDLDMKRPFPEQPKRRECSNESNVMNDYEMAVFEPLKLMANSIPADLIGKCKQFKIRPNNGRQNGLLIMTEGAERPACIIEYKTPWSLCIADGDFLESWSDDGVVKLVAEQLFYYMAFNWHKYGVVSTGNQTWFFCREEGILKVSPCVDITSGKVFSTWLYFLHLIGKDSFCAPPAKAVTLNFPNSSRSKPKGKKQDPYEIIDLFGKCQALGEISGGFTGCIFTGKLDNSEEIYIFKVFDLHYRKQEESVFESRTGISCPKQRIFLEFLFEREVYFYQKMKKLQGKVIPKFIQCGKFGPGLRFIILEDAGKQMNDELCKSNEDTIKAHISEINKLGLNHNDLRPANILIKDGQIRIIDFGFMTEDSSASSEAEEIEY